MAPSTPAIAVGVARARPVMLPGARLRSHRHAVAEGRRTRGTLRHHLHHLVEIWTGATTAIVPAVATVSEMAIIACATGTTTSETTTTAGETGLTRVSVNAIGAPLITTETKGGMIAAMIVG
jgi:hypothetical protein